MLVMLFHSVLENSQTQSHQQHTAQEPHLESGTRSRDGEIEASEKHPQPYGNGKVDRPTMSGEKQYTL